MKKTGMVLLPVVTVILELLPYGAVLIFADSPTERIRKTFSYFSLAPVGYANFAPFITGILTCVLLVLTVISLKKANVTQAVFVVSLIAAIFSFIPLLYGLSHYSVLGGIISALLVMECFLSKLTRT